MSNRDVKPEIRIERMIEEEQDPKQRAILVLLHYLTVSVSASLDKLVVHTDLLDKYNVLLNKANGASFILKIVFGVTHSIILALLIMSINVMIDVRDSVKSNAFRVNELEKNISVISQQVFRYNESSSINQKQIIENQK